jgi:hypothetical protein
MIILLYVGHHYLVKKLETDLNVSNLYLMLFETLLFHSYGKLSDIYSKTNHL